MQRKIFLDLNKSNNKAIPVNKLKNNLALKIIPEVIRLSARFASQDH